MIVGFYAGLNLIAWFMIFCFVRETKLLTLEEIDREFPVASPWHDGHGLSNRKEAVTDIFFAEVFSVPTRQYIGYELKVWLPYFIKRHVLRRKIPKPAPIIDKENTD